MGTRLEASPKELFLTFPYDALLVGAVVTCLGCVALVLTQRWHARWSIDGSHGVQKFHTHPTPRVAGIAIVLGLFTSSWFLPADVKAVLMPMLWASLPAFVFGFVEDLTKKVGVRERLLATIASGILAWWLTGISLDRVNVWGVDALLAWAPVSVLFTAFAIGGVANAVNIIDGFNGLASGVVMICLTALGVCAYRVGDPTLAVVCTVLVSVVAGFWLVNFPLGKIFLGDGGAYLMGFCLGWIAVLLPMRNPGISPWASLLACAYPILEVLFSIVRRHRRNMHPGHPDRLHLHSLIKTRIVRKRLTGLRPVLRNSAVSPMVWFFAAGPALLAVTFYDNLPALILSFFASALAYAVYYRTLVKFGWFR